MNKYEKLCKYLKEYHQELIYSQYDICDKDRGWYNGNIEMIEDIIDYIGELEIEESLELLGLESLGVMRWKKKKILKK